MVYLVIVLLVFGCIIAAAWFGQRALVFPGRFVPAQTLHLLPGVERLTMDTDQGEVEAWLIPGKGVTPQNPGPLVVYAYGNGERIDLHWPDKKPYVDMGISVLLPEYRGYNRSAGSPSQRGIVDDFTRWRALVAERPEVDASRVIYHGRSLGGGIVAQLAAAHPPRALILESTFTSLADAAWDTFHAPRWLIADPLDVRSVLETYDGPVLIMHGLADEVIGVAHAEMNHAAASNSRLLIHESARHNDPAPPAYWHEVEAFLRDEGVIR